MSWDLIDLNSICRPRQWKTLSMDKLQHEGFPVYGANGKIGFYSDYTHELPTLAITCRGATCGSVHITDPMSYINGNAMALDNVSEAVDIKFLYYFFQFRGFNDVISGSAQPQITGEGLSKVQIPLPPLETQKRIADILDTADALRLKDLELLKKYDELAQAIFIDMFGDPVKNEKGWVKIKLKDICFKIADIDHKMPVEDENGLPFISAKDLKDDGTISFENVKKISISDFERLSKKIKPELNDIIYSRIGAKLGKARKVITNNVFIVSYSCCTIKPNTELINTDFLCYYLDSPFCLNEVLKKVRSIGVPDLGMDEIRDLKIPYPAIKKQEVFSDALSKIEYSKEKFRNKFRANLFNSLLQKAFKGELI